MAAETPVLERTSEEKLRMPFSGSQSYEDCFNEEKIHNSRIRGNYLKLINPDSRVEDLFADTYCGEQTENNVAEEAAAPVRMSDMAAPAPAPSSAPAEEAPYLVRNARADSVLFHADSPINRINKMEKGMAAVTDEAESEDEDEDLRPTPTTIQYQTITKASAKTGKTSAGKSSVLGKKEKIIIAVVVTVIVALLALVILNSTIIAGLNADIASVQSEITAVRGALAGVNSSISEMVPEAVRELLIR